MIDLTTQLLLSFDDELVKCAGPAELLRHAGKFLQGQAGAAAAGVGTGSALGGLAGGALGGIRGYREARDAGGSRGESALYSLMQGTKGLAKGGLIGGAAGGALGLAGGSRARELAKGLVQREVAGAPARTIQRQLHSLTGYADREGLRAMRGGAYQAEKNYADALRSFGEAQKGGAKPGLVDKLKGLAGKAPTQRELDYKAFEGARTRGLRAESALQAARQSEEAGLTSVPGVLKGLAGQAELGGKKLSPVEAIQTMTGEQWRGSGPLGKATMLAFPGMGVVSALRGGDERQGRLEGAGKALGAGLAYSTPMGLVGQALLAKGFSSAGGLLGSGGDVALKRRKEQKLQRGRGELPLAKTGPEPDEEHSPNPEMLYSHSALGRPPEGMGG